MGYTTEFNGNVNIEPALSEDLALYVGRFTNTRRMSRDVEKLKALYKGKHGLNGEYGENGELFAKDDGQMGQSDDGTILNYNSSSNTQPGLWCQWVVNEEGDTLYWDGSEKFYGYVEWMKYMIDKIFEPNGHTLNGEIEWRGEDFDDCGTIYVKDNKVQTEPFKEEKEEPKEEPQTLPITHRLDGVAINETSFALGVKMLLKDARDMMLMNHQNEVVKKYYDNLVVASKEMTKALK